MYINSLYYHLLFDDVYDVLDYKNKLNHHFINKFQNETINEILIEKKKNKLLVIMKVMTVMK